jgi:type 1 fimbria pilin
MNPVFLGIVVAPALWLTTVLAADSVDLTITALFDAPACTPALDHNGEANFGHIPLSKLNKKESNQLGSQFLTLTISCAEATPVGWSVTDNKKDSVHALTIISPKFIAGDLSDVGYEFGLGKTREGVNLGAYAVYTDLQRVTGDGNPLKVMYKYPQNSPWYPSGAGEVRNDNGYIMSGEPLGSSSAVPMSARVYIWPLKITAAIQGTDALNISDDTPLAGSLTISVVYL